MRLIDADVLIKHLCEIMTTANHFGNIERVSEIGACIGVVKGERTFNIKRPRGEWIESKERKGHFYCSECVQEDPETGKWRETFDFKYPFCPNCGADMRKGGNDS